MVGTVGPSANASASSRDGGELRHATKVGSGRARRAGTARGERAGSGRAVPRAVPCPKLRGESGGQQGCAESANAVNKQAQKATGKLLRGGKAPGAVGFAGASGDLSSPFP